MLWVQIPEDFTAFCCQLTVESLFYCVVVMQIDLRGYPHTVGVTTNFLVTVGRFSSGKNDYLFFVARTRTFNPQTVVVFIFAPSALTSEDILQAEAVRIADIQLCVRHGGTGGKVDVIGAGFKLMCESVYVINGLSGTNSSLQDVVSIKLTGIDIIHVFLTELKRYRLCLLYRHISDHPHRLYLLFPGSYHLPCPFHT